MPFPLYEEFDVSGIRTHPLNTRASKARVEDFGRPCDPGVSLGGFIDSLPNILGAADFKAIVRAMVEAKRESGLVWGLGAHVIKTGLGPVLIDLMERGFVSAIATNGAAVIHDFEVALAGATSEDVDESLGPGRFGMAEETGRVLNEAITEGVGAGLGIGQAVGRFLATHPPQFAPMSVLAAAARLQIPVTVHVAIGTDIIHMHPAASGRALGEGQPARFPLLRLERRAPRTRRLSQLRIGGRAAGSVSQGRRCPGAQQRPRAVGPDDGEPGLPALMPGHRPTSWRGQRPAPAADTRSSAITRS